MKIERYASADGVRGRRPSDVLASRLFDLGAEQVTVYSNVVTVEAPAASWGELEPRVTETVENLFGYYGDDAGWSPEALGTDTDVPDVADETSGDSSDDSEKSSDT